MPLWGWLSPSALDTALAERDADIFDRVVLIDIQIPSGSTVQVEAAVPR